MSDAPCITQGYYYEDDFGGHGYNDDGNEEYSDIYIYSDYMIKDFTKELKKNGFVIFNSAAKKTPEEIKRYRLEKDTNKYNL